MSQPKDHGENAQAFDPASNSHIVSTESLTDNHTDDVQFAPGIHNDGDKYATETGKDHDIEMDNIETDAQSSVFQEDLGSFVQSDLRKNADSPKDVNELELPSISSDPAQLHNHNEPDQFGSKDEFDVPVIIDHTVPESNEVPVAIENTKLKSSEIPVIIDHGNFKPDKIHATTDSASASDVFLFQCPLRIKPMAMNL